MRTAWAETTKCEQGRNRAQHIASALVTLTILACAPQTTLAVRTDGPFNVLEWTDEVKTSRSGYAVWVSIESTQHQALIPGYSDNATPPQHGAVLHVACRAPGGSLDKTSPANTSPRWDLP